MTLQQLQYVVALDTYRHYVKAAEKCFVTQPTITIQVKKLEETIGFAIFDKSETPFKPTPSGELFIQRAKVILSQVEEMKNMVSKVLTEVKGTFKLAVIPTISPYLIPPLVGRFSKKYPDTFLDIEEMKTDSILEALQKKEIDLGILVTPVEVPFIREIPLFNESFWYYGNYPKLSHKKSISSKDIESIQDQLWLLSSGHCFRNQVLNICGKSNQNKNVRFQSGSIEVLKKMVDMHGGFTLVPELAINKKDKSQYLPFKTPKPIREVSIVVHQSFNREALIKALRTEILSSLPKGFKFNKRFVRITWK
ncbi:MAG TPA: hydrogen peroxide-inducible genes activator [Phaeodactylibacter sp.]|nr:hydrogen peroxide-inducible genes activator [Phaeodactylibacter sp.]